MTRLKNVQGHPPSYGKPWNLSVCQKYIWLFQNYFEEEEIIFEKIKVDNIFNYVFLLQWQKKTG